MAKIQGYQGGQIPNVDYSTTLASGTPNGLDKLGEGLMKAGGAVIDYSTKKSAAETAKFASDLEVQGDQYVRSLKQSQTPEQNQEYLQKQDELFESKRDSVSTPEAMDYFEKNKTKYMNALRNSLNAKNAELSGLELRENYAGTGKNQANIVYNNPNPENFKSSIEQMQELTGKLTENDHVKGKLFREQANEIASSNFLGAMTRYGGAAAVAQMKAGLYDYDGEGGKDSYLSPEEKVHFEKMAKTYDEAKKGARDNDYMMAQRAKRDADNQMSNQLLIKEAQGTLSPDSIMATQFNDADQKRMWMDRLTREQKQIKNPSVLKQNLAFARIADRVMGNNDPNSAAVFGQIDDGLELEREARKSGITDPAKILVLKGFLEESKSAEKSPQFQAKIQAAQLLKKTLIQSNNIAIPDAVGTKNYNAAFTEMNAVLAQRAAAGEKIDDMLDPSKPDYLPAKIAQKYRKTPAEINMQVIQERKRSWFGELQDRVFGKSAVQAGPAGTPAPTGTPAAPTRPMYKKGMSMSDYNKQLDAFNHSNQEKE